MYEHRRQRLLTPIAFAKRILRHVGFALLAIAGALIVGIAGYHFIAELGWIDSLLNAAMILSGMGPVNTLTAPPAKLFASAYALFSGLVFVGILGVLLAPFIHRIMHTLHIEESGEEAKR